MTSAFGAFLSAFSNGYKEGRGRIDPPGRMSLDDFMAGAIELMPGNPSIVLTINGASCNYGTSIGMAPQVAEATRQANNTRAQVRIYSHSFLPDVAQIVADQMAHTVALIESQ